MSVLLVHVHHLPLIERQLTLLSVIAPNLQPDANSYRQSNLTVRFMPGVRYFNYINPNFDIFIGDYTGLVVDDVGHVGSVTPATYPLGWNVPFLSLNGPNVICARDFGHWNHTVMDPTLLVL